jgi:hypothetical protein
MRRTNGVKRLGLVESRLTIVIGPRAPGLPSTLASRAID